MTNILKGEKPQFTTANVISIVSIVSVIFAQWYDLKTEIVKIADKQTLYEQGINMRVTNLENAKNKIAYKYPAQCAILPNRIIIKDEY
jgi:hypothetical protein